MRFVFIQQHARIFHIAVMCYVLKVSRAGYYKWRAKPLSERMKEDRVLADRIRSIHTHRRKRSYGSPRIHRELRSEGVRCGEKRIARIMREEEIRAKASMRYRVTTQSGHKEPVAENILDRRFDVEAQAGRDRVWVGDITYIPTREGWVYLGVIIDLASRMVVGWSLSTRLDQEVAVAALRMALRHRRARGGLFHSDRGVQYASRAFRALLQQAGFTQSMSRVGDCWDNAVVESFFATVTKELLIDGIFETRSEASREIFEFIEIWYNRQRLHSSLGYRSPMQFEEEVLKAA
jgi:transposase InsO family protein